MIRLLTLLLLASTAFAQDFDVLIRNGKLVDGCGNPWSYADVGITRDRITFIGHADSNVKAKRVIDATGLIVAPGFIDMLGQSESSLLIDKQAFSKITQGITTEITGEGGSIAPVNERLIKEQKDWTDHYHVTIDWHTLDQYFNRLNKQGAGVNLGTYVGAAQVRDMIIGQADRPPTENELKDMQELVQDAMFDGALGVSSALIYAPGSYAKTDELIALAQTASKFGGIYATHMRNEGDKEDAALDEVFRIAKDANIPVEIFHLKVAGKQNWGKMQHVIERIESARAQGLDITADQYPYIASATSLSAIIPPEYHEGGSDAFVARLKDPTVRAKIRAELSIDSDKFENMWRGTGGPQGVLVTSVLDPSLRKYEGKTVAQIAQMDNKDPLDSVFDLIIADHDNVGAIYFEMNEADVKLAMQQPFVSVGTDYGEVSLTGPLSESKSHPRAWGSFPRILGRYVREQHALHLEDAIRKFTSLAAQRVHLDSRGLIKQDYFADIAIFDPQTVIDKATFEDPAQPSQGIEYVLVNGIVELDHGQVTGQVGGRGLRGPAYSARGISPEGLAAPPLIEGTITTADGYPLGRTHLTLADGSGAKLAETNDRGTDGHYELTYDKPCENCTLSAERAGFISQKRALNFNGSNPLWFSFTLQPAPPRK
jgi:N-acyl-D-amino-acid deacylase